MATFKEIKNNAFSTVVSGELNNTTDPVTFDIATGDGAKFPTVTNGFWATVWDAQYNDPGQDPDMEILLVTARTGDEFVASRGQLGTSAVAHAGEPKIALLFVDQQMKDVQDAINDLDVATTKGDLLVFNGTDYVRVGVGSNDQVLTADSAEASGVKWAAASGGGSSTPRVEFAIGPIIMPSITYSSNAYGFKIVRNTISNVEAFYEYCVLTLNPYASSTDIYATLLTDGLNAENLWDKNITCLSRINWRVTASNTYKMGHLIGVTGTSYSLVTRKNAGFYVDVVSGTNTAYTTNSSGTTQTSTNVTATMGLDSSSVFYVYRTEVQAGVDIKFYRNGTLLATHTTNMPSGAHSDQANLWQMFAQNTTNPATSPMIRLSSIKISIDEA